MKFNILAHDESYGKHRFSNNAILDALAENSSKDDDLSFVWWVEKMFLSPQYEDIVQKMIEKPWFGVMHVPLLTPNWAMYSQNNLSKLYYLPAWREGMKNCRGIIALSEHMRSQLKAIYPGLKVFALKHPIPESGARFDIKEFEKDPKLLLVGAWLRNFDQFSALETNLRKMIIINHYAEGYIKQCYHKYRPRMLDDVQAIDHVGFLENDEYDQMFRSSLLYLSLHETSANNALCECISYETPFVAKRHPAIIEYCGADYPLLVDDDAELNISTAQVSDAHAYLKQNKGLKKSLSMSSFVDGFRDVYSQVSV